MWVAEIFQERPWISNKGLGHSFGQLFNDFMETEFSGLMDKGLEFQLSNQTSGYKIKHLILYSRQPLHDATIWIGLWHANIHFIMRCLPNWYSRHLQIPPLHNSFEKSSKNSQNQLWKTVKAYSNRRKLKVKKKKGAT